MTHLDNLPPSLRAQGDPPYIIAHRGSRAHAPENSMAAFRLGFEQGAHALETDLHITADRHIVCIHDPTLERTTNGSGEVRQKTLDELKSLRLRGNGRDRYPKEQIPTLAEVFTEFASSAYFLLELKSPGWTSGEDVHLLVDLLQRHDVTDRVILASFSRTILACVRQTAPELPLSPISLFNVIPPADYPLMGVWYPMLYLNPLYVWMCHRRGQIFCPLDPTPEPRLPYYLRLGVDFLLSDDVQKTVEALEKVRS